MKEKLLKKIKESLRSPEKGQNRMGCSEAYYDPYYLVGKCFSQAELKTLNESELENLLKLAKFASDVFY